MKVQDLKARLIKKAATSPGKYRIAAVGLDWRGTAISSKTNVGRFQRKGGGLHAEALVMKSSPPSLRTIVICRLGQAGDVLPISPCPACARLAKKRNVRIVSIT